MSLSTPLNAKSAGSAQTTAIAAQASGTTTRTYSHHPNSKPNPKPNPNSSHTVALLNHCARYHDNQLVLRTCNTRLFSLIGVPLALTPTPTLIARTVLC